MTDDPYQPRAEHRFTFGLWTVGRLGQDPFGDPVRSERSPSALVELLSEVGAWGVNLHDDDLVPIDASAAERDRLVQEFRAACKDNGITVAMMACDLFHDPAFRGGAFTSHDPGVRAYALQKAMGALDIGAELGARIFAFWGGREGVETLAGNDPLDALGRLRDAIDYLCAYSIDRGYDYRFALEAKPNEPRAHLYLPTTGAYLGFIPTLRHPDMVGVNPEVAHERMAGLEIVHAVAQAWDAGKLFHIDLNDQMPGRFDQDLRFGAHDLEDAFWLVKFLEDVGYEGPRHFDAHAYRTADWEGVHDFARGCMRTYLVLKERAGRWNEDERIRELLAELADTDGMPGTYTSEGMRALRGRRFDRGALASRKRPFEALSQRTVEILLGVG